MYHQPVKHMVVPKQDEPLDFTYNSAPKVLEYAKEHNITFEQARTKLVTVKGLKFTTAEKLDFKKKPHRKREINEGIVDMCNLSLNVTNSRNNFAKLCGIENSCHLESKTDIIPERLPDKEWITLLGALEQILSRRYIADDDFVSQTYRLKDLNKVYRAFAVDQSEFKFCPKLNDVIYNFLEHVADPDFNLTSCITEYVDGEGGALTKEQYDNACNEGTDCNIQVTPKTPLFDCYEENRRILLQVDYVKEYDGSDACDDWNFGGHFAYPGYVACANKNKAHRARLHFCKYCKKRDCKMCECPHLRKLFHCAHMAKTQRETYNYQAADDERVKRINAPKKPKRQPRNNKNEYWRGDKDSRYNRNHDYRDHNGSNRPKRSDSRDNKRSGKNYRNGSSR